MVNNKIKYSKYLKIVIKNYKKYKKYLSKKTQIKH